MAEQLISFDHLIPVLDEYGKAVKALYQQKLKDDNRNASYKLTNNIDTIVEYNGREYEVKLSLEKYWRYIEMDTAPHWTPYQAILDWVKVKPVIPRSMKGLSKNKEVWQKQLTFLIRRKIAVFGTTGTPNLTNSVEETNARFEERIKEALALDMAGYIRKVASLNTK